MATVRLERVSKSFPGPRATEVAAVQALSLTVGDGEFVALVGPSGCGKTTTLRLIAGLESPSGGAIHIDGREVTLLPPQHRDTAMVFQNAALYPHLNVAENLAFGLRLRRRPRTEVERRVRDTAELLGLTGLLERLPSTLSGGQRQRVALGRAIIREPKVFLLDEPLSNLDPLARAGMRRELARLRRQLGATFLHVTHDQAEAMALGDRVAVMQDGVLQQVATPRDLYRHPANLFVAGFIGSPPMNLLPAQLRHAGGGVALVLKDASGNTVGRPLPLPVTMTAGLALPKGDEVMVGVRPEDLQLGVPGEVTDALQLAGTVELVEPFGPETWLHVNVFGYRWIMRTAGDLALSSEATLPLLAPFIRLHFFAASDGRALAVSQGQPPCD